MPLRIETDAEQAFGRKLDGLRVQLPKPADPSGNGPATVGQRGPAESIRLRLFAATAAFYGAAEDMLV